MAAMLPRFAPMQAQGAPGAPIAPRPTIGAAGSEGTSTGVVKGLGGRGAPKQTVGSGPSTPIGATPVSSSGPSGGGSQVDYSKLLQMFGSQNNQPAQPMTNTSSPNPTITDINAKQLDRANGDMNAANMGRASDIAIRDNAENERKAGRERAAFMGTSGGGVAGAAQSAITRDTLRAQTGARTDIANDAERRRDALYGQIAGQAATDEQLQDQQRNTGIRQQQANQQAVESARSAEIANFRNILSFFDTAGAF